MYIYEGKQLLFYTLISLGCIAVAFLLTCAFAIPKELTKKEEIITYKKGTNYIENYK